MTSIAICRLGMEFGAVTVLDEFGLDVGQGEFMTILGASGSGKSTLLGIISGLRQPARGRIFLGERDITNMPANQRNIGLVFQSYALFPTMNVFDNVAFPLRVRRRNNIETRNEVKRALSLVQLDGYEARRISELSGGQQQRVALARALVFNPSVLLLDEPLGALDRKLRQEVQGQIRDLQRKVGITTLMVTHDQEEALSLSDRIAIINSGQLEQVGTPSELFTKPATAYVADFFGSSNIISGRLCQEDDICFLEDRGVRFPCRCQEAGAENLKAALRPESIRLDEIPASNGVDAIIEQAVYLGTTTRYRLALENGQQLVAVIPSDQKQYHPSARVRLHWRPEDVWLIPDRPAASSSCATGGEAHH